MGWGTSCFFWLGGMVEVVRKCRFKENIQLDSCSSWCSYDCCFNPSRSVLKPGPRVSLASRETMHLQMIAH